jgi:hypothetical protein
VTAGSTVCHDIATLLPEHLPLAAPAPANCNRPIVISPLSSLLLYGAQARLAAARSCFYGAALS